MVARIGIALVVLVGLTAFAPAPLPKKPRMGSEAEVLKKIQGDYEVQVTRPDPGRGGIKRLGRVGPAARVRIQGNQWIQLVHIEGRELSSAGYAIKLNTANQPIQIDILSSVPNPQAEQQVGRRVSMYGLLYIEGDSLRLVYRSGFDASVRPKGEARQDPATEESPSTRILLLKRVTQP